MTTPCRNCGFFEDLSLLTQVAPDDLQLQLSDLDSEIAHAQASVAALQKRRLSLLKKINSFNSPILQLPLEISSDIFMACLPEISWEEFDSYLREAAIIPYSRTPLLLGMVCSMWRELAWSMPRLWSRISLNLEAYSPSTCGLLREWLGRSGECSLTIHLSCFYLSKQSKRNAFDALRIIIGCSERWHRVFFSLLPSCYTVLQCVRDRLPLLAFVALDLDEYYPDPSESPVQEIFSLAPQLCHVEILSFSNEPSVGFPFRQLTNVLLSYIQDIECLGILAHCPQLSRGVFRDLWEGEQPLTPVFVSRSKHLELHTQDDPAALRNVLNAITSPSLSGFRTTLKISEPSEFRTLLFFISRSGCSLQQLSLDDGVLANEQTLQCLRHFPSLVNLSISVYGSMETLIHGLNPKHPSNTESTSLLPNLQVLELVEDYKESKIDFVDLGNMLVARWESSATSPLTSGENPVARLQSVSVKLRRVIALNEDTLTQLRQLAEEGMDICLWMDGSRIWF